MEISQLEKFVAATESITLSKAAEKLFITQSAMSKAINILEDELQLKLFDRTKNSMTLNKRGSEILVYAKNILNEVYKLKVYVENIIDEAQTIKFCSFSQYAARFVLYLFNKYNPETKTSFLLLDDNETIKKVLLDESADLAIIYEPISDPQIYCIPFFDDRTMVSIPPSHPYYKRNKLNFKDLHMQSFLVQNNKLGNELLAKNGIIIKSHFQDDPILYYERMKTTKDLCFTSIVDIYFHRTNPENKNVYLTENALNATYYAAYKRTNKKAEVFRKWLHENFKRMMDPK